MNLILTSCLPENKWAGVGVGNEMGRTGEEGSCNCVNKSIVSFSLPLFLSHQHRPWAISWEVRLSDTQKNTFVVVETSGMQHDASADVAFLCDVITW